MWSQVTAWLHLFYHVIAYNGSRIYAVKWEGFPSVIPSHFFHFSPGLARRVKAAKIYGAP